MSDNKKMPKQVYVFWESDPHDAENGGYWIVQTSTDGIEKGTTVGIYGLKETRKMVVTRFLE